VLTFDPRTQQRHGDTGLVNSSVLASSPDGTILASGDHAGVITLFDFETSRVLYRVSSLEHNVRQISFSSTGLRFYDIRGDRCIVWEPSVLVRRNDDSSFGFSEVVPMGPEVTTNRTTDDDLAITTMWHITAAIISSVAVKMELWLRTPARRGSHFRSFSVMARTLLCFNLSRMKPPRLLLAWIGQVTLSSLCHRRDVSRLQDRS
jgi:hypothetical protein